MKPHPGRQYFWQVSRIRLSTPWIQNNEHGCRRSCRTCSVRSRATWALPAAPYAGPGAGFVALPPVGAGVWIEFEQGNPDFPIWCGGWWGQSAELPVNSTSAGVNQVTLATPGGHAVIVSDASGPLGGITLRMSTGAHITVSDAGIMIDNGHGASITLIGNSVRYHWGSGVRGWLGAPFALHRSRETPPTTSVSATDESFTPRARSHRDALIREPRRTPNRSGLALFGTSTKRSLNDDTNNNVGDNSNRYILVLPAVSRALDFTALDSISSRTFSP